MSVVSVIVLTYNNLIYLPELLYSVFKQDYPFLELIISDDGSEDFNRKNIETFIGRHKRSNIRRVVIRQNAVNMGTVKNLNAAIQSSTGDYIVPIAGDDAFSSESVLTSFAKAFQSLSDEDYIVTSQVEEYDVQLEKSLGPSVTNFQRMLFSSSFERLYGELALDCFIPAGGTAYRRSLFERYGFFDESYKLVEDWPFALRMTRLGIRYHFCDFVSVKHRRGGISNSSLKSSVVKQYQTDLIRVMEREILPNLSFAAPELRYKIRIQCKDKLAIYQFRYEYPYMGLKDKCAWLFCRKLLFPTVLRGFIRKRKVVKHG